MAPLTATYRLQFHRGFTLRQALELVPYLAELGISHVYASPLLAARSGSTHGYDVCDPTRVNPELGTEEDLAALVKALRARNMGLILDIVPNHMSAGPENPWWWDILQHGRASRYAQYFDIDWDNPDPGLRGKILLPVLGDPLPLVLKRGELRLDLENSQVIVSYFDHRFPASPASIKALAHPLQKAVAEVNASTEALVRFLEQQTYRVAFWRAADQAINYRRFFNIADLAGLRVEDPQVFQDTHCRILRWARSGDVPVPKSAERSGDVPVPKSAAWSPTGDEDVPTPLLDGLRIDHPDGLYDPRRYLQDLRERVPQAWIVVEKILVDDEKLPANWPVQGTTGYDFLNRLGALFIDPRGEDEFTRFYGRFTGEQRSFDEVALEKKRLVLGTLFHAELGRLERALSPILSQAGPGTFKNPQIREALIELAACFPVYRTYVQAETGIINEMDRRHVMAATTAARQHRPELAALFDSLQDLLLLRKRPAGSAPFVMLFQQLTGPAMAKGVEDTAFYCFNRFAALNEVGGSPGRFGLSLEAFHESCREAHRSWPMSLLASSTHDTKRGEDMRARLAVLSQLPNQWMAAVGRWSARLEQYRRNGFPDRNLEYLFYQTLVGAWPLSPERALAYLQKAAREAKEHTSWSEPNADYENAVEQFARAAFNDHEFVMDLESFATQLAEPGWVNSLAQTLIKLTAPGIPDNYQGCELWDLSLVDPDNRRPVDFTLRRRALENLRGLSAEATWQRRAEGLPKLWLIWRTLLFRGQRPDLFGPKGSYQALKAEGPRSENLVAFVRGGEAITVTPRLVLDLKKPWSNTALSIPVGLWQNELTSEIVRGGAIPVPQLLARFPVALLSRVKD